MPLVNLQRILLSALGSHTVTTEKREEYTIIGKEKKMCKAKYFKKGFVFQVELKFTIMVVCSFTSQPIEIRNGSFHNGTSTDGVSSREGTLTTL